MNILVINGPNLNLLGERQKKIYGHDTLEELMIWLENSTLSAKQNFKFYQSNWIFIRINNKIIPSIF